MRASASASQNEQQRNAPSAPRKPIVSAVAGKQRTVSELTPHRVHRRGQPGRAGPS